MVLLYLILHWPRIFPPLRRTVYWFSKWTNKHVWNHENTSDYYSWTLKIFSIFNIYNCFCMMVVHFFIVIISYYSSVSCMYKIRKLSFDLPSNQANFSQLLNHNIGNLCCLASSKILFHYFSTTFNSFKSLVSLPTFLHLKESLSSNICVP